MFNFKKIILALICVFAVQNSFATEFCGAEGDFVPWPWSDSFNTHIAGQNWILMDSNGVQRGEITISKASFLWGWRHNVYSLIEKDLTGHSAKWGMARSNSKEVTNDNLNFNLWNEADPTARQTYRVKLGYWDGAPEMLPVGRQWTHPLANNTSKICRGFRENSELLLGLMVEVHTYVGDQVITETLFGLTTDPIYVTE